jgi:hypothetical protein
VSRSLFSSFPNTKAEEDKEGRSEENSERNCDRGYDENEERKSKIALAGVLGELSVSDILLLLAPQHHDGAAGMRDFSLGLLSLLSTLSHANIYQISAPGQNGAMNFTSALQGGEIECNTLLAQSLLTIINLTMIFNGNKVYSSFPSDMFLLVSNTNTNTDGSTSSSVNGPTQRQCLQYGGYDNYQYSKLCPISGNWPISWETHTPGVYSAIANFSSTQLTGTSWEICIGNGYIQQPTPDPDDVYYEGQMDFSSSLITSSYVPSPEPSSGPTSTPSVSFAPTGMPMVPTTPLPTISSHPTYAPTHRPTAVPSITVMPTSDPFQLQSTCSSPQDALLSLAFNTHLSGKQVVCTNILESLVGTLSLVNMTLLFSGSTTKEFPYDLLFEIILHSTSANNLTTTTTGLQIGGFDQRDSDLSYVGPWPDSWKTTKSGIYHAVVDVSSYGLNTSGGQYEICLMNGWKYGKKVSYSGLVTLPTLSLDCDPFSSSLSPTLAPSSMNSLSSPFPSRSPTGVSSLLSSSAPRNLTLSLISHPTGC